MTGGGFRLWRRWRVLVIAVVFAVLSSSCGPSARAAATAQMLSAGKNATKIDPLPLRVGLMIGWGAAWSLNPLSSGFLPPLNGFSLLPLAIDVPPRFGQYRPELASSWQTTATTVTIHLRRAAWQDGAAVTSRDVVTALELQGTETQASNQGEVWSALTGVRTPDPRTVVVTVRAGQSTSLVLDKLLGVEPVPASQYGRFLTPGLAGQLEDFWSEPHSKPGEAAARIVARLRKRIDAFSPRAFIGDGPYRFVHANTTEIVLTKWSGFWDASAIHVPALDFVGPPAAIGPQPVMPTPTRADLVTAQLPYLAVQAWLGHAHTHATAADTFDLSVLALDEHFYPVNLLAVRRALAEVINRRTVMALANGGGSPDRAVPYPTGLPPSVQRQWLPPAHLDAYSRDLRAAAKLLRSSGFHRRAGRWYEPDGRRLTVTINASTFLVQTPTGAVASAIVAMLASFGIRVLKVNGIADLDWGMSGEDGLDPLVALANLLGPNPLFTTSYRSLPANSRPARADVPGLGTVAIAPTLGAEAASVDQGPLMRRLAGDWARYVNGRLPYLTLAENYEQVVYSSARYTDWPDASSPLWDLVGLDGNDGLVDILEHGFIRPAVHRR